QPTTLTKLDCGHSPPIDWTEANGAPFKACLLASALLMTDAWPRSVEQRSAAPRESDAVRTKNATFYAMRTAPIQGDGREGPVPEGGSPPQGETQGPIRIQRSRGPSGIMAADRGAIAIGRVSRHRPNLSHRRRLRLPRRDRCTLSKATVGGGARTSSYRERSRGS